MSEIPLPRVITWYRCPLPPGEFKKLHERSDLLGGLQTVGFLAVLACTGGAVLYSGGHWPWWVTVLLIFLHGMMFQFLINGVHELGHGTVFKTKFLNELFVRIYSFLSQMNFAGFNPSHARHHRYTLHQPDDLEVVLPATNLTLGCSFKHGIVRPLALWPHLAGSAKVCCGRIEDDWGKRLFPPGSEERRAFVNWQRAILGGHAAIFLVSGYFQLWLLPVVTTLAIFYGGWLQALCNNTQHVGLQDDVSDFRLCCRTFTVNPVVQFLYWHMNFHIEHHMYAAVPCYRLGRLHRLIEQDLPPTPHGLIATWKEIAAIQAIQDENPEYEHVAFLPERT